MNLFCRPYGEAMSLSSLILLYLSVHPVISTNTSSPWPLLGNGLQDAVQRDHYSIIINDQHLLLFCGEMHPFRLPAPELWEDVLEKIKAMGLRMVSIYTHWGFRAPTPDPDSDSASAWTDDGPETGFTGAGVRFYRGTLHLDVPPGLDVSLAFRLRGIALDDKSNATIVSGDKPGGGFRVLLFVNGWQFGRYYPDIASEDTFPVPVGVLDYSGENVVSLAVWTLQEGGARVVVDVIVRYVVESSLDVKFVGRYLRPGVE
ncbi:hypothetical protein VTJ49DRAFT_2243 [Mycothermus thermophilus]|uniref:beta-galactosidase n=1 Tax=Humicola insolens TaxID=85995 RepID=A0ABR3VAD6_HUMIN